MSTRNRIPSGIGPYLQLPPEASLILLTGTLGCSPNWLTALFVGSILRPKPDIDPDAGETGRYGVILVSWMRDLHFWKDEIRRTTVREVPFPAQLPVRGPNNSVGSRYLDTLPAR